MLTSIIQHNTVLLKILVNCFIDSISLKLFIELYQHKVIAIKTHSITCDHWESSSISLTLVGSIQATFWGWVGLKLYRTLSLIAFKIFKY